MTKVFVVTQESCVDGEHLYNVNVCATLEIARELMKKEIDTILDESPKYKGAREDIKNGCDENFTWDFCDNSFDIHCMYDACYEYIEIEEKEILT